MKEHLVTVYRAPTVMEAQRAADLLKQAGIECFVYDTESPMYGAPLGPGSRLVQVRSAALDPAHEVIREFEEAGHPQVPREDWPREETGLELPRRDRPTEDSPNEPQGQGTEKLSRERPGIEAPESPDLEEIQRDEAERPLGWGAAGEDLEKKPEIEQPEIEEERIDRLDIEEALDENP
jgi:hypothetical protein